MILLHLQPPTLLNILSTSHSGYGNENGRRVRAAGE